MMLDPALLAQLEEAGRRGFLGPRAVAEQAEHAGGFGQAWDEVAGEGAPAAALDLGSGGGVPGLVLAVGRWPECRWTLLDAMAKRCAFLEEAVDKLGLAGRVSVACGRTEELGRPGNPLRDAVDLVTSRGFGAPALTAEAAAPFLRVGGLLIVSEPPDSDGSRWDVEGCARVGLVPERVVRSAVAGFMVLRQVDRPEDGFPRSPKAQRRQPLFHVKHPEEPTPSHASELPG
jgi:16S rRNA (guanine527-N7)-methyltransferase